MRQREGGIEDDGKRNERDMQENIVIISGRVFNKVCLLVIGTNWEMWGGKGIREKRDDKIEKKVSGFKLSLG